MGLFDFDIDYMGDDVFDAEPEPVTAMTAKEKAVFSVYAGADLLARGVQLPGPGEALRMISYAGQFSSCSVVLWIAGQTKINSLYITTLRVGKKELQALCSLRDDDRLGDVHFILSGISKENTRGGKDYGYTDNFEKTCADYGFTWRYEKNHSKVILLDTEAGKITVETSSNFNENPKVEQFCITRDAGVYEFYKGGLFA
jgi:hypothetical protein